VQTDSETKDLLASLTKCFQMFSLHYFQAHDRYLPCKGGKPAPCCVHMRQLTRLSGVNCLRR